MGVDFFNKYKNQSVTVLFDDFCYDLNLDEVVEKKYPYIKDGVEYFSFYLIFSSDNDLHLNQGLYKFKFGEELKDIFIVPVQPEGGRFIYQAVFN
ncbi:DUF6916 family protein [Oceanospirillum maris]|uniref:DUF6916 family protein n=1 Tax=Oceanospirillum maris TaxID=64977 RepID=UPI0003FB4A1A|nr:hypothetical protein [Oceanospirillum maris]